MSYVKQTDLVYRTWAENKKLNYRLETGRQQCISL